MPFKNREDQLSYNKIYWQRTKNVQRIKTKEYRTEIKHKVFSHYCNQVEPFCECCHEARIEFLSLDHINGGGTRHRKTIGGGQMTYRWIIKNNYPAGFRVLCHNCNQAMGFYGYCPHNNARVVQK